MTTTIAPSIGHAPLLTQAGTGTSPGYDAVDFRRLSTVGLQEGVLGVSSCEVTQRGAGANMSVDIATSTADALGTGIMALVQGDAVTAQGLYPVPPHTAVINETITAAHATLPRIDQVILEVKDNTHDASGSNLVQTRVVAGTATSGATLDNRTGAAALPSSALLLADVLVGAAVSSISNSVIRDRRKWARGAYYLNAPTTGWTRTSTTLALIDSTAFNPRIECSGVPVRVRLTGTFRVTTATDGFNLALFYDGVDQSRWTRHDFDTVSTYKLITAEWVIVPAAGSRKIGIAWATISGTGTVELAVTTNKVPFFTVEELVRQNTANNATTTG